MSARPFPSKVKLPEGYSISDTNDFDQIGILDIIQSILSEFIGRGHDILIAFEDASSLDIIVALCTVFGTYVVVYTFLFVSFSDYSFWRVFNETENKVEEPPVDVTFRNISPRELKNFNGSEGNSIYIAIKGVIYDVSCASELYGPDGTYSCYAGREAGKAMAKMSFDESDFDRFDLDSLSVYERECLKAWITKFTVQRQYPIVGKLLLDEFSENILGEGLS